MIDRAHRRPRRIRRTCTGVVAAVGAAALLAACGGSGDGSASSRTSGSATDARGATGAAPCPVAPVDVVVSVDQWSDLVGELAGDCARVTTVLASSSADPHDYEPTPADAAKFAGADLVVLNGLYYDDWARRAAEAQREGPRVLDAGAAVGLAGAEKGGGHGDDEAASGDDDHGGVNPHIWYSPDHVNTVAAAVTAELKDVAPDAAAYFDERAARWKASVAPYLAEVASMKSRFAGTPYIATESVFDYGGDAVGLVNATPDGYRDAAANETDPSPADIAAFEAAVRDGSAKVVIVNPQTDSAVTGRLRSVAESAGVPVVAMTETAPADATSFVGWQLAQLRALAAALGGAGGGS